MEDRHSEETGARPSDSRSRRSSEETTESDAVTAVQRKRTERRAAGVIGEDAVACGGRLGADRLCEWKEEEAAEEEEEEEAAAEEEEAG